MYVWTNGFNPSAQECGGVYPPNKDGTNALCFNHNWETSTARQKLWASCSQPGREVTRLFVADMKNRIQNNGYDSSGNCDAALVSLLSEAHNLGVRVYALFSDSTAAFNEKDMAPYPGQFNANCGTSESYFDGVAVNNEYFANIKGCDSNNANTIFTTQQQEHLDLLKQTADNAAPLPLHFSVSWNWDSCSQSIKRELLWPASGGTTKSVVQHMVEIVDSVDVQVAYIKNSTIAARSENPYQYWTAKTGKSDTSKIYALSYTNPTGLCQTSYSPHIQGSATVEDTCTFSTINPRTQAGMYQGFDYVEGQHSLLKGGIHYMNGVYGSDITSGWPVHSMPNPAPASCSAFPGQCSDGTGGCSETDLTACECSSANRRNLFEVIENGDIQTDQSMPLLRGSGRQRKLRKAVKTPGPSSSPTLRPTDNPTPFECKCVLPTPTSSPSGASASVPIPCTLLSDGEGTCTSDGQCCSGNCHTGGGPYADKCKPA